MFCVLENCLQGAESVSFRWRPRFVSGLCSQSISSVARHFLHRSFWFEVAPHMFTWCGCHIIKTELYFHMVACVENLETLAVSAPINSSKACMGFFFRANICFVFNIICHFLVSECFQLYSRT